MFPPMAASPLRNRSATPRATPLPCKRSRARPTQTCTVTNGTVPAAPTNVTDVAVNCTTNTYTIGGTVSGLAGTGLVLAERRCADGVGDGQRRLQLPDRHCIGRHLRRDGADAAQRADANLFTDQRQWLGQQLERDQHRRHLPTNTYTVGGAVSGLTGSGLVLSLNAGAQTLTVAANGAFTFPTALASGSNYAVTYRRSPRGPRNRALGNQWQRHRRGEQRHQRDRHLRHQHLHRGRLGHWPGGLQVSCYR